MKKRTKVILIILAAVVVLQAAWIAFCGWKWGWGPFHKLSEYRYRNMPGNADQYAVSQVQPSGDETLKERRLSSSVPPLLTEQRHWENLLPMTWAPDCSAML